jgi:hypothetical protein
MDNSGNIFKKLFQLFKTSRRPPPKSGDELYDSEEDVSRSAPLKAGIINDLKAKNAPIPADLDKLLEVLNAAKSGGIDVSLPQVLPRIARTNLDRTIDPASSSRRQSGRFGKANCPTRVEFASAPAIFLSGERLPIP